ncbi:MAG: tetratricopeptide repeat protein, partial [Bilophila sp.]
LSIDGNNINALTNLGVLAMQHDHIQAALPLLQTALNARPQQVQFWKSAIKALYEVGEYAKCVEISTRYLSLNPADAEATAELARTQLMLMDENAQTVPENIWQILERAQALQPESPAVLRNLARARLRSKQLEQALEAAEKACQLEPAHPENQLVRASALLACSRNDEARTVLTETLDSRPNYAEALSMQGFMLFREKCLDEAAHSLSRSLQLRPHMLQSLRLLGAVFMKQDKRPEVIALYERYLALRPSNCTMLISLAELYRQEVRYEQARALLERALSIDGNNINALTNLAVLLHSMTHIQQAVQLYQKILELEPGKTEVLHNLGAVLLEQGNVEDAVSIFERIVAEKPDAAMWRLHLLQALMRAFSMQRAQEVADELESTPELMHQLDAEQREIFRQAREKLDDYADTPQAVARYKDRLLATHECSRAACAPLPAAQQGRCPMTALIHMGRSGSNFFHSLLDGHPELVTLPGMYFAGWFEDDSIKRFSPDPQDSHWREKLVSKILDTYEPQFDARSTKNTPGKPFGDSGYLAKDSGFTTMGPNRDVVFQVDKDIFVREMLKLLQPLETVGCAQCFEFIHKAYCAAAGQQQWAQNPAPHLFYHIHNPSSKELESFLRHYPQANMLKLVRHPIQGLESWMRGDLNAYEKLLEDPHALPPGGNLLDNCLTASWQKAAQKAAQRIHSVQDACTSSTRGIAVRIEDVKRRPRDIMPKVAAWMGIADSEALYASTFNGIQYWGPVSSSTRPITGFDTASMDKPLGRLFGSRDLIIMETLFYPMLVLYRYAEP